MTNTYELVNSLLPGSKANDEDEDEDDDVVRDSIILLLRLEWAQTSAQLNSIEQELELLLNAPPEEPRNPSNIHSESEDMWRLDAPPRGSLLSQKGPLIDSSGKASVLNSSSCIGILTTLRSPYDRLLSFPPAPEIAHDSRARCLGQIIDYQLCPLINTLKKNSGEEI